MCWPLRDTKVDDHLAGQGKADTGGQVKPQDMGCTCTNGKPVLPFPGAPYLQRGLILYRGSGGVPVSHSREDLDGPAGGNKGLGSLSIGE